MGEAKRRRLAGDIAFKTPRPLLYDHLAAVAEDKAKEPGRLCASRTDTAEFLRIASDPTCEVPRDQWHPDDVSEIERMLSASPGRRIIRRDDGLYAFADKSEFS